MHKLYYLHKAHVSSSKSDQILLTTGLLYSFSELPAKMMRDDPMRDVVCQRRHHLSRGGGQLDETLSSTLRDERQPSCTQE